MDVYTPKDGVGKYLDSLRGLRPNLIGTPKDQMNTSSLSYQDLIQEIGRGKINIRYYPDEQEPPSTHIAITRHGEVVHLELDADNYQIYLLVEERYRNPLKKNQKPEAAPEKNQIRKPQGRIRSLLDKVLRRA